MKYHSDDQFFKAVEILCKQIRELKAEIKRLEKENEWLMAGNKFGDMR
jgi:hypothetical protein